MRTRDFVDRLSDQAVLAAEQVAAAFKPEQTDGDRESAEYEALVGKLYKDKYPPLSDMPKHQLEGRLVYFTRKLGGEFKAQRVAEYKLEIARTQAEIGRRRTQETRPPIGQPQPDDEKPLRTVRIERRGRPRSTSRTIALRRPGITNPQQQAGKNAEKGS